MIGSFLYSRRPRPDDLVVWLTVCDGRSSASLVLPQRTARLMRDEDYPAPAPVMSVESALSYAIFLAIRSGASLVISGDRAGWNSDWGFLTNLDGFHAGSFLPSGARGCA